MQIYCDGPVLFFYLQKLYKRFFRKASSRTELSLAFIATILRRTDVTGEVKNNFTAHKEFLRDVSHEFFAAQAMEYFGMVTKQDAPTQNQWPDITNCTDAEKHAIAHDMLSGLLTHHRYGEFSFDGCGKDYGGEHEEVDELYNYCSQFCVWALHILEMEDTAREADLDRLVANTKHSAAFFYSHSKRSHYLKDCLDFVLKTQYLLSPQESLRVLEGAFVNPHGGRGKNIESDLKVEHTVRLRKELIRGLGANKSERAILRATGAADVVDHVVEGNDAALGIRPRPNRHTRASTQADKDRLAQLIDELEPFRYTPGRGMPGCSRESVALSPFTYVNGDVMVNDISVIVNRIIDGVGAIFDDDADVINDSEDDGDLWYVLTNCGLLMPYDDSHVGLHYFR